MSVYGKRGSIVRILYLGVALFWWLCSGFGLFYRNRMIVFCYHGILNHQRHKFRRQMIRIAKRVISGDAIDANYGNRKQKLPSICLTFDDAFENLITNAFPILMELNLPATIFVVTGNLGTTPGWSMPPGHPEKNERTMTWDQIKATSANELFQFGSHTLTHPNLTHISDSCIQNELVESKNNLEEQLGTLVTGLALPYGAYDDRIIQMAQDVGYKRIFTLDHLPVIGVDPKRRVGRFSMSPDIWEIEFILTCSGAYAWLYPWRRLLGGIRRYLALRKRL